MENIEKIIYYDGIKFILHESKKYHYNSTLRRHLHQYIWEKAHGAIPKGWEVHHKDLNVNNNDLDNLEAMPAEEHRALHSRINKETGRNREARIKNLEEKARPKACEWHGSEAGIEWHKEQYKNFMQRSNLCATNVENHLKQLIMESIDFVLINANRLGEEKLD